MPSGAAPSAAPSSTWKLCPHPQDIIDRFEPEFENLLLVTLMLPWGEAA